MQIYMFRSQSKTELQAFSGDPGGNGLPVRLGPWHAIGVIKPDRQPPHGLPRGEIEKAILGEGFQLWRKKVAVS